MNEIQKLKKENEILRKKLAIATSWMEKNIREQTKKIAFRKVNMMTSCTRECFLQDNIEEIITKKISSFFGEIILMNIPTKAINNIISAEINYYNLKKNPSFDGLSVISSYHKTLDIIIESFITKEYRKFCKKSGRTHLKINNSLEKALHNVVNKGYILSVGRLFHLIDSVKNEKELHDYGKAFVKYLDKSFYVKGIILDDDFYNKFDSIIKSEVLGSKRHNGKIKFTETRSARKLLIGDFKDEDCIIYKLFEINKVDI